MNGKQAVSKTFKISISTNSSIIWRWKVPGKKVSTKHTSNITEPCFRHPSWTDGFNAIENLWMILKLWLHQRKLAWRRLRGVHQNVVLPQLPKIKIKHLWRRSDDAIRCINIKYKLELEKSRRYWTVCYYIYEQNSTRASPVLMFSLLLSMRLIFSAR